MMDLVDIVSDNWLLLLVGQYPNGPLGGIACTLILSVLGIVLAFPLSVLLALARLSPWPALRSVVTALVYGVRGVPLLMLILWVYFLVPLFIGRDVSGFTTMLCTLVIYEGVYLSEVVRAGIEALPKGQMEAARALGHSYLGAMRVVILPQALYNMLPSMLAQFVSTIKETTLGYVINVPELTFAANQINNALLSKPFQIFFLLAVIYFAVCWSLTRAARALEHRIAAKRAGKRRVPAPEVPEPLPVEP
ncbi:amino acid ABC transporter permease (plasmid) [Ralstonia solanacearum]|uniref:Amino acid ABC transporter transmembrane protein n=2 Tax=Ralstonia solanacearum species complex TaxID=3116862 RepID=A0A0S4WN20_RALSL|nr:MULTISPECIES: amino acid ABC transporter permease [Ralstonia solanacearum species complex]APF89341.1 amino acid ABC transporter permease [Ralstonia solanacearum FJAT-1458]ARS59084.1 amino acid ABC transporter permease [Ralstonia solanacearum FJAT-91]AXV71920.1 amino acid ABC transporter permease [Ralstonia solanacearum]ESS50311.1 amino acid ABC transporter transmembrane protein [Ralstonia solanacearum SD54]AST88226.1 amino acid ABC transporter permease [Ralstonia pseudosolanacearum]